MNDRFYKVINVQRTNGRDACVFSTKHQAVATAKIFHTMNNDDYRVIEFSKSGIKVISDNGNENKMFF